LVTPAKVENLVQMRDLEDLEDVGAQVAQDEVPARGQHALVKGDEDPQHIAVQELDLGQVQDEAALTQSLGKAEQILPQDLAVLAIQHGAVAAKTYHDTVAEVVVLQDQRM